MTGEERKNDEENQSIESNGGASSSAVRVTLPRLDGIRRFQSEPHTQSIKQKEETTNSE